MAHWYIVKNGVPQRYEQLTKKGLPSKRINRGRAFRDGAVMGTTDTLKVLGDVGGLLTWKGNLGIRAGMNCDGDLDLAKELLEQYSTKAADRGTEIHDAIEQYLKSGELSDDPVLHTAAVEAQAHLQGLGVTEYVCEHCFVWRGYINVLTGETSPTKPDGFGWVRVAVGGTADFVSDLHIRDWKSIEDKGYGFRGSYAKEAAQCAMYRLGFARPDADCANVYFDRADGRIVKVKEWTEREMRLGLRLVAMAFMYSNIAERLEA